MSRRCQSRSFSASGSEVETVEGARPFRVGSVIGLEGKKGGSLVCRGRVLL